MAADHLEGIGADKRRLGALGRGDIRRNRAYGKTRVGRQELRDLLVVYLDLPRGRGQGAPLRIASESGIGHRLALVGTPHDSPFGQLAQCLVIMGEAALAQPQPIHLAQRGGTFAKGLFHPKPPRKIASHVPRAPAIERIAAP